MASFSFNFRIVDVNGNGVLDGFDDQDLNLSDARSGTMSDNNSADGNFNLGESWIVAGDSGGFAGFYQGSVVINGETFFVFLNSPARVLFGNVTDPAAFKTALDADPSVYATAMASIDTTSPTPVCFAAGTCITTPSGETPVDTLRIGDLILTADGRAVPVKWIGRQTIVSLFAGDRARPVRVTAGALGNGLPHTDLVLTADHALILEGFAINAGALVNGATVTLDPAPDRATYYHVETEEHDVILANGVPAESFVDYVGRTAFDNYAEYVDLYGQERGIAEMPLARISSARLVPRALRARLADVRVA